MRVLVLGHTGMLGNAVQRYFGTKENITLVTITARYPDNAFFEQIQSSKSEFIVNCIGAIPQQNPTAEAFQLLNEDLPKRLDTLNVPILYPSTDCEFDGTLPFGERYSKSHERSATDAYGSSKARASAWIEREARNTKMIRTSIIGHEISTHRSLLNWFLAQTGTVRGYTNHYWNGITTLEWAKQCFNLMVHQVDAPAITQLATEPCISKYALLCLIRDIYQKDISIDPHETDLSMNKCLLSDIPLSSLTEQLIELRSFYAV